MAGLDTSRRQFLIASGASGTAMVSGCLGGITGGGGGDDSIQAAASVYPTAAASTRIIVGIEKGIFEDNGVTVEDVISFGGGAQVTRGISSAGIEVGLGGLAAVVQAYLAGAPLQITGLGVGKSTIEFLSPKSEYESITDIAGAKIAVTGQGGSAEAAAIQSIRNADGISVDDVEFLYLGGLGEGLTAVEEGEADIAWAIPSVTLKLVQGPFHVVWSVEDHAPFIPSQVYSMGSPLINDTPDRAAQIMEAFIAAADYVVNNMEESARLWAEASDREPDFAVQVFEKIGDLERYFRVRPQQEYFVNTGQTMIEQGLIEEQPPWKEIIDQSVLPEDKQVDWLR